MWRTKAMLRRPLVACAIICATWALTACTPDGMVAIPGGDFHMGCSENDSQCDSDERPYHLVTLSSYYIDQHEVTVADFRECVESGSCAMPDTHEQEQYCNWGREGRDDHPVNCVDWNQANAYCRWKGRRLPTEAEWEYAARGNDGRVYPWGNAFDCHMGNFDDEQQIDRAMVAGGVGCDGFLSTSPVCSFPDGNSPFGLCDMAGNVLEWCNDWSDTNYYASGPQQDPQGPTEGSRRIYRGGSWFRLEKNARTSYRLWGSPDTRNREYGFRCAQTR